MFKETDAASDGAEEIGGVENAVDAGAPDVAGDVVVDLGGDQPEIRFTLHCDVGRRNKAQVTAASDGRVLHEDRFDLVSAMSRKKFANILSRQLLPLEIEDPKAAANTIALAVEAVLLSRLQQARAAAAQTAVADNQDPEALLEAMPEAPRKEAEALLRSPSLINHILTDITKIGVAGENLLKATIYVLGVSRLLPKPLAAIVHGHTASGKSYTVDQVSMLFPEEALVKATQMTPHALYHLPPGSLMHRWVVAGERSRAQTDETAEATRALREMLSAGRLSKLVPMRVDSQWETVLIEQDGPIAYTETTTVTRIFGEDLNRCLSLTTDETEVQTRRILLAQATSEDAAPGNSEQILLRHHALQRMLALVPARIVVPYAQRLAELFPIHRLEARRAYNHTLSMIRALALLHHRQRQIDSDERIVASRQDYRLARQLLAGPLARTIGGAVSDGAKGLLERLRKRVGHNQFSSRDAYAKEQFSSRHVRDWLGELSDAGFLEIVVAGGRGKATVYRIVAPAVDDAGAGGSALTLLPEPSVLFET